MLSRASTIILPPVVPIRVTGMPAASMVSALALVTI